MSQKLSVSLIPGDGIGPEIIESVVRIFEKASVPVDWEYCTAGAQIFQKGIRQLRSLRWLDLCVA